MKAAQCLPVERGFRLGLAIIAGLFLVIGIIFMARSTSLRVQAAPIPPPEGYPKFNQSVKIVTPTLAYQGGATLHYVIEIRNTGAYTAENVRLTDPIPANTTYNGDAQASSLPPPTYTQGTLSWTGEVGFDASVIVSFSVDVSSAFSGIIQNLAIISHPMIAKPVTVTAETVVTDQPILTIQKTSTPSKPGPNKLLTYEIIVKNEGQPASSLPITVTDRVPISTSLHSIGPDGFANPTGDIVTWTRSVALETGATSVFTFSVDVDDVSSGTVISNADYQVFNPESGLSLGEVYTVTVIDPILYLSKSVQPDPPGSNRELTYTLTLLNQGSLATNLVITDHLPVGVAYVRGGSYSNGVVSWSLPSLDTGESVQFSFTGFIGDMADIPVLNDDYSVCSSEGVCQAGRMLTSTIYGPTFEARAMLDPIAKKPGGGTSPVTPTLVVQNLGPGNALDATALMYFRRISVQGSDLIAIPPAGNITPGPVCGDKCVSYIWRGDLGFGEMITFTTIEGQNSVGGSEGTHYTATLVITDSLGDFTTAPITATAIGNVTHLSNLIPTKSAPPVIGAGQFMTYTIKVFNSGLSTDTPPFPILTDTVPSSTTLVSVSDGGVPTISGDNTVISWTLPSLSPGGEVFRSFAVQVLSDLVSGTQIINDRYGTLWYENEITGTLSHMGDPITTVVKEVGLIDSFKTVTPTLVRPGPGNILTYTVHVVNSSPMPLAGVQVYDQLPWQSSTYQRDAVASSGQVISDIVSIEWSGDVAAFSSQVITFSVLVDEDFQGVITNTAIITHPSLLNEVVRQAVAYVTNQPVLKITKTAAPDPVEVGHDLLYTIQVVNLGQQATNLVITDTIPAHTEYVPGSASGGGQLIGSQVRWEYLVLKPGEGHSFTFKVKVLGGEEIVNDRYRMMSEEGVAASGSPVITKVFYNKRMVYLPIIFR